MLLLSCFHVRKVLRKMGMLPCNSDTAVQAADKLRAAFLSSCSSGIWQTSNRSGRVRRILSKARLLTNARCSDEMLATAMAKYMQKHGLPEMKTFNGRIWQVLHHSGQAADPNSAAGIISFRR